MKKLYIFPIILLVLLIACTTEDDSKPTVLTTADHIIDIQDNVIVGDTIGIVPGTSNKGTISYEIVSQTPDGAFTIGETYGELIVADASLISSETNPQMTLEVMVSKEDLNKISNVIINVSMAAECLDVDLSFWEDTITIEEDGSSHVVEGVGTAGECGILTLAVTDFIDFLCDQEGELLLRFIPSENDDTTGMVIIDEMEYACDGFATILLSGTGEYDISTGTILLDYAYEGLGPFPITGSKIITIGANTGGGCTSTVNTAIWNGTLDLVETDPDFGGTSAGEGVAECGELIVSGDLAFSGCDAGIPEITMVLTPESTGATNGTVTVARQSYDCFDGFAIEYEATGTYDELTEIIELNYNLYDGDTGDNFAQGVNIITVASGGGGTCTSTVNTVIWDGALDLIETDPDLGGTSDGEGVAECGELIVSGDLAFSGCDAGIPEITLVFTPESAGATNGTVTVARQTYDCFDEFAIEYEATGTYDELTEIIELNYNLYDGDTGDNFAQGENVISPKI
ncbi:cadherin repeat domain-containing protein [uncultured Croceitalea sp.]|uniref:cadherin repeat domain-containing protein n=1 Tax=uncultured Croceitalea sp. TaxID=1798908 RepID=UPI00374F095F